MIALPNGVKVPITEPNRAHTDAEEINHIKPWLVAAAPGFGFGTPSPGEGVTIKLPADVPVTGRVAALGSLFSWAALNLCRNWIPR